MTKNTDNPRLSPNRPARRNRRRTVVENDEFAAFCRRIIRAYARRVAAGDVEALADMTRLSHDLNEAIGDAVTGLHSGGYSWTEIAARLDISRQAARQRWQQP
jgi:DNA-directed RNA polymerase specialized sigma24 family protein